MNRQLQVPELHATTLHIRVRGLVQGVGYRPWVWQVAQAMGVCGEVHNDPEGVEIHAEAADDVLEQFITVLREQAPPLARVDGIEVTPAGSRQQYAGFTISASRHGVRRTGVLADAATCQACLAEVMDPLARRYGYAFTNCTHCGPRFSIQSAIPWDRANTSMAAFPLCPACQREYQDPLDRRFHAQPLACPECGPRLWLEGDLPGSATDEPITRTAMALQHGAIVAIKGIGGFHLACDAFDIAALGRLRQRKQRPDKPFAIMARDLTSIRRFCLVSDEAASALESHVAPVVLLPRRRDCALPEEIAPGQQYLGFMLPHSPLHHLLMLHCQTPLVMTSANRSGEPQVHDNQQARESLCLFADGWLMHDRPIRHRIDDSVMKTIGSRLGVIRRARGLAPTCISLPEGFQNAPATLALGSQLKNTFCLIDRGQAVVSQHIGDLDSPALRDDYLHQLDHYQQLFALEPQQLACDLHADYFSSQHARELGRRLAIPLITVPHHHAHMAACMADNALPRDTAPLLGLMLDGLGLGEDNALFGGELLLGNYCAVQRIGGLKPVLLPGGELAQVQPWRNAWAQLQAFAGGRELLQHTELSGSARLASKPLATLEIMAQRGLNSPPCSSAGRLIDAVSWWLGLCPDELSYEGQAAMNLESAALEVRLGDHETGYPFDLIKQGAETLIDPAPLWIGLIADQQLGESARVCAARFLRGFARALARLCLQQAQERGISQLVLSGGVFQNHILTRDLLACLPACTLQTLTHQQIPCNDAGLSFGQACIAAARALEETKE